MSFSLGDFADDAIDRGIHEFFDEDVEGLDFFDESHRSAEKPKQVELLELITATDKAWRVRVVISSTEQREMWLPKSQCSINGNTVLIPAWLFKKKCEE